MKRWIFDKIGCNVSLFIHLFLGFLNVYLLAALSQEKYLDERINSFDLLKKFDLIILFKSFHVIMKNASNMNREKKFTHLKTRVGIIFFGILSSLFWSLAPVFGWSNSSLGI